MIEALERILRAQAGPLVIGCWGMFVFVLLIMLVNWLLRMLS